MYRQMYVSKHLCTFHFGQESDANMPFALFLFYNIKDWGWGLECVKLLIGEKEHCSWKGLNFPTTLNFFFVAELSKQ